MELYIPYITITPLAICNLKLYYNMRLIYLFLLLCLFSCEKQEIGYLKTENASYTPNTLEIRKEPDPVIDAIRIQNKAPWTTLPIEGVLGTPPIHYEIIDVKASDGGDAELFRSELSIIGGGIMYYPMENKAPKGAYTISIKIWNEGHNKILQDAFTFIIK